MMIDPKLPAALHDTYGHGAAARLAAEGQSLLSGIPRMESFAGKVLMCRARSRNVALERQRDYERVIVKPGEGWDTVRRRCDKALREMGERLESCLKGKRIARMFGDKLAPGEGVWPIDAWEGVPVTLYSLGPCPQLLDIDGISMLERYDEYGNRLDGWEVRFGYYANVGPSDRNIVPEPALHEDEWHVILPRISKAG